ncbi:MAG: hypothetical protein RLW68_17290 [Devosia marina]|uniref:hypothetical protein n=1 Tax=Devosia marina TaxID=2683198 RepID=UPI0032EABB0F
MLNTLKTEITEILQLSRDALHIHVGLAFYLAAMLVLRRGPASWLPWFALLGLEIFNEALDTWHHGQVHLDLNGSAKDIVNTMFWPTVLLLAFRWRRQQGEKIKQQSS